MLDRQKVEAILSRRFPGAGQNEVATAANAIMGLADEWEEIVERPDISHLAREEQQGHEFRLFRRKDS